MITFRVASRPPHKAAFFTEPFASLEVDYSLFGSQQKFDLRFEFRAASASTTKSHGWNAEHPLSLLLAFRELPSWHEPTCLAVLFLCPILLGPILSRRQ